MNKEINLIHTKSQSPFARIFDRITVIRFIAFSMLTCVSALSIAFFLLVSFSPLPALRQQENAQLSQMQTLAKKKGVLLVVHDRLTAISKLLATRSDIATLIQNMDQNLSGSTRLTSFSIDKKLVKLQVESSSLSDMDAFLDRMSQKQTPSFTQVVMDGINLDQNRGVYIAGLSIQL
jgi:D-alanyl-D-alanine dipeptidase